MKHLQELKDLLSTRPEFDELEIRGEGPSAVVVVKLTRTVFGRPLRCVFDAPADGMLRVYVPNVARVNTRDNGVELLRGIAMMNGGSDGRLVLGTEGRVHYDRVLVHGRDGLPEPEDLAAFVRTFEAGLRASVHNLVEAISCTHLPVTLETARKVAESLEALDGGESESAGMRVVV